MNPNSIYSKYQIALTRHRLGQYTEAQEQFQQILQTDPNYTPALKGMWPDCNSDGGSSAISASYYKKGMYMFGSLMDKLKCDILSLRNLMLIYRGFTCFVCSFIAAVSSISSTILKHAANL